MRSNAAPSSSLHPSGHSIAVGYNSTCIALYKTHCVDTKKNFNNVLCVFFFVCAKSLESFFFWEEEEDNITEENRVKLLFEWMKRTLICLALSQRENKESSSK